MFKQFIEFKKMCLIIFSVAANVPGQILSLFYVRHHGCQYVRRGGISHPV